MPNTHFGPFCPKPIPNSNHCLLLLKPTPVSKSYTLHKHGAQDMYRSKSLTWLQIILAHRPVNILRRVGTPMPQRTAKLKGRSADEMVFGRIGQIANVQANPEKGSLGFSVQVVLQ
ncbi:hypothetical protein CRM22_004461 [Opisthorchis felineus]|uniref:Uncharacterized protein n=1 Tax=Opisthorchis felineus TaxID=147828 RepID=A0A4S2M2M6_OPIFE|nr:hypothetical protein CRM22_004461 [Opisthorchis felineus]